MRMYIFAAINRSKKAAKKPSISTYNRYIYILRKYLTGKKRRCGASFFFFKIKKKKKRRRENQWFTGF